MRLWIRDQLVKLMDWLFPADLHEIFVEDEKEMWNDNLAWDPDKGGFYGFRDEGKR